MKHIVSILVLLMSTGLHSETIQVEVGQDFKWNSGCKRYTTQRQCQNKRVCRLVCSGATGGLGNGICNEVCELIPECSNVVVCQEYY